MSGRLLVRRLVRPGRLPRLPRHGVVVFLAAVAIAASAACAGPTGSVSNGDVSSPPVAVGNSTPPVPPSIPASLGPGASVRLTFSSRFAASSGTGTIEAVACGEDLRGPWNGALILDQQFLDPADRTRQLTWTFDPALQAKVTVGPFTDKLGSGAHSAWLTLDLRLKTATAPNHVAIVLEDITLVEQGFPTQSLKADGTGYGVPNFITVGTVPGC